MDLSLPYEWPKGRILRFTFFPQSITDFFGQQIDTTNRYIRIAQEEDFGRYILAPMEFDTGQYVFQLMREDKMVEQVIYSYDQQETIVFDRLIPGDYSLQIIDDAVPNGRWDPGNYLDRRQSESIYTLTLPELRPNWVEEEEILYESLLRGQNESQISDVDEQ